jgi:predicted dehydrogenase
MEKIKVGVIGTGHLGKLHTKMFALIEECKLVGVYDKDSSQAASVAKEFDCKSFETIDDLLNEVDAVSIAAITSAHHEIGKYCLQKGVHIFIEKPITVTIEEAEDLVKTAREKKLNLQVGHIERFNPALLALEKYNIEPKFIQTDRLAQFNPRGTDVAVVLDLMIHDIDIILSLIKSEVAKVDASGVAVVSDTIDIANARIEFENGAIANVTASRISQKKMRKMRIFQRDNYISLDFTTGVSEVFRLVPADEHVDSAHINYGEIGIGERKKKVIYEQPEQIEVNALMYELRLFVLSVLNNEKPIVSGEDGLRALKVARMIIDKIEDSIKKIL